MWVGASHAIGCTLCGGHGRDTLDFFVSLAVISYLLLLFFVMAARLRRVSCAVSINSRYKRPLVDKFAPPIRATVKGNVQVAVAQGALGSLDFLVYYSVSTDNGV
ncbi:hypothetical protein ASF77_21550 [Massilia sp. Leaf139]|nr:hypothetical protein ASF77_21550 [Massilia sp. Leaf139]